jgi:predicted helicase
MLQLKPAHKAIKEYYSETDRLSDLGMISEGTVSPAFAALLRHCAAQVSWTLNEKVSVKRGRKTIIPDGIFLNDFNLYQGAWEAKDSHDKLDIEVRRKFADGYPKDNIIFQSPEQIIVWQNSREVFNAEISKAESLIEGLNLFFSYQPPAYKQWEEAAEKFREQMPHIGKRILELIDKEYRDNKAFVQSMEIFTNLCRDSINPNIAPAAVKEMLIQHLLTERIFRKVFDNPDFTDKNTIAVEIEKVISALTSRHFSRSGFLQSLDPFYKAIETTAATIEDYTEKQFFLNTVYEKFFQGFAVKAADTHGIVYTPQPVVDFMVRSVEDILQKEFGRSLSDKGVHILDPFVGTGNFIIRIMREIRKTALPDKYRDELHCNEVLLLPYYIASTNIEHEYYEITGEYKPFDGICLVDTFELAEDKQMSVFTAKNTDRVNAQKQTPIFVIIGNPPYNAGQVNENDNNKNRKYRVMDKHVAESYAKDSKATNKNALSDVYVKAVRWASEKIAKNGEGIVAFVTNNSFVNEITFDGMRNHLAKEFDKIYILDLGGNVRKNPKLSGTTHNVFGIQVGVSVNIFVKKRKE